MKHFLWVWVLLVAPAFADEVPEKPAEKVKWRCDELDRVRCPRAFDKTDYCEATDGIDTFNDKAKRDDSGEKVKPKENSCLVSVRVVSEICESEFEPRDFTIQCTDIEEEDDTQPARPVRPPRPGGGPGGGPGTRPGPGRRPGGGDGVDRPRPPRPRFPWDGRPPRRPRGPGDGGGEGAR